MSAGIPRIVILGAGFGGLYCALELERALARHGRAEVTLVNRENFHLFTPMLHDVAASDLDVTHIVNPIRKLLRHVRFWNGHVLAIDTDRRVVRVTHTNHSHDHELPYDHLVVALGSVTRTTGVPGLTEHALTLKSLDDAIRLRGELIERLEQADAEPDRASRAGLLSVVIAGGGFAGIETAAGVNDFLHEALRWYPHVRREDVRLTVVHSGDLVLPELGPELGAYAGRQLAARGVEILTRARVREVSADTVTLTDGRTLRCGTLVWTAGTAANPIVASLPFANPNGRVAVDATLRVPGVPGTWALGDAAEVPDAATGAPQPPTAQHALRQGRHLARNLVASLERRPLRPFRFSGLGQLAAIGRRTGVARIFGVNFSGFFAWWLWRTVYLSKLPRFEKKLRVMLDWTLDLAFTKDIVQFTNRRAGAPHGPHALHAPAGDGAPSAAPAAGDTGEAALAEAAAS